MYLFLYIFLSVFVYSSQETVKITVYYESLCPGSQEFINDQLYPTYQVLGDEYLTLELFPFSKVKKLNVFAWYVHCQHGKDECIANKAQACALMGLNATQAQSVNFVGCAMSSGNPEEKRTMKKCARKSKIPWRNLKNCMKSDQGNTLMAEIYNSTLLLNPKLRYVPHILFNDEFNRTQEEAAGDNLMSTVCQLYKTEKPAGCSTNDESTTTSNSDEDKDE